MGVIITIVLMIILAVYTAFNNATTEIEDEKANKKGLICYMNRKGDIRMASNGERVVIKQDVYNNHTYIYDKYGTNKLVDLTELIKKRENEEVKKINMLNDDEANKNGSRWSVHLWLDPAYTIKTKYGSYKAADVGKYSRIRFDLKTKKEYKLGKGDKYYVIYMDNPYNKVIISESEAIELGYNETNWSMRETESPDDLYNRISNEFYSIGV